MSTSVSAHNITSIRAESSYRHHWLRIAASGGTTVTLHMPREQAEAIAAAWQAHQPKEAYDEEGAPA